MILEVYQVTKNFPREENFGITSQIRRCSFSIAANIAEGFGRFHYRDKIRFYYQSRGSIFELQNFIILARDLGYIDQNNCKKLGKKSTSIAKLINGLIRSVEKTYKSR